MSMEIVEYPVECPKFMLKKKKKIMEAFSPVIYRLPK